jgi:hypothetical protein
MDEDYEDYDYDEDDPCDHDEYDVDILTGRAHCWRCGHAWWLSSQELRAELKFQCEAAEAYADEMSKEC